MTPGRLAGKFIWEELSGARRQAQLLVAQKRRALQTIVVEAVGETTAPAAPSRATEGSACFDVYASEPASLSSGRVTLVGTGWRMRAPEGSFLEVRPRSGLSSQGVLMVNSPGTIDRDYAGEVKVPLTYLFAGTFDIRRGDRIAQIRLVPQHEGRFRTGRVRPTTDRAGGFGSTGR